MQCLLLIQKESTEEYFAFFRRASPWLYLNVQLINISKTHKHPRTPCLFEAVLAAIIIVRHGADLSEVHVLPFAVIVRVVVTYVAC